MQRLGISEKSLTSIRRTSRQLAEAGRVGRFAVGVSKAAIPASADRANYGQLWAVAELGEMLASALTLDHSGRKIEPRRVYDRARLSVIARPRCLALSHVLLLLIK